MWLLKRRGLTVPPRTDHLAQLDVTRATAARRPRGAPPSGYANGAACTCTRTPNYFVESGTSTKPWLQGRSIAV